MIPYLALQKVIQDYNLAVALNNDRMIERANENLTQAVCKICNLN